jgi:hypothetical protein
MSQDGVLSLDLSAGSSGADHLKRSATIRLAAKDLEPPLGKVLMFTVLSDGRIAALQDLPMGTGLVVADRAGRIVYRCDSSRLQDSSDMECEVFLPIGANRLLVGFHKDRKWGHPDSFKLVDLSTDDVKQFDLPGPLKGIIGMGSVHFAPANNGGFVACVSNGETGPLLEVQSYLPSMELKWRAAPDEVLQSADAPYCVTSAGSRTWLMSGTWVASLDGSGQWADHLSAPKNMSLDMREITATEDGNFLEWDGFGGSIRAISSSGSVLWHGQPRYKNGNRASHIVNLVESGGKVYACDRYVVSEVGTDAQLRPVLGTEPGSEGISKIDDNVIGADGTIYIWDELSGRVGLFDQQGKCRCQTDHIPDSGYEPFPRTLALTSKEKFFLAGLTKTVEFDPPGFHPKVTRTGPGFEPDEKVARWAKAGFLDDTGSTLRKPMLDKNGKALSWVTDVSRAADGTVALLSFDPNLGEGSVTVMSQNRAPLATFQTEANSNATVAFDGKRVLVLDADRLIAFTKDGNKLWQCRVGGYLAARRPMLYRDQLLLFRTNVEIDVFPLPPG